jgi:hypothetical protein
MKAVDRLLPKERGELRKAQPCLALPPLSSPRSTAPVVYVGRSMLAAPDKVKGSGRPRNPLQFTKEPREVEPKEQAGRVDRGRMLAPDGTA